MTFKYNTILISSKDELINSIKDGYIVFKYTKKIKSSVVSFLEKIKNSDDRFLFAYLYESIKKTSDTGIFMIEEKVITLADRLIDENDFRKNFILGYYFYLKHTLADSKRAFHHLLLSAKAGFALAQYLVANCYYDGEGIKKNLKKAFYWYSKTANQGYIRAMIWLAFCYSDGEGIEVNLCKAFEWYLKAAENGEEIAMYYLGGCYENGDGVKQDYEKAFYWYSKAAKQGYAGAMWSTAQCYYYGTGIKKNFKKAFHWYSKAADRNEAYSMSGLGDCYYFGHGVKQDYEKAFYWYSKAADNNDIFFAPLGLGRCYHFGHGVKQDYAKAFMWSLKAAEAGDEIGMAQVGYSYDKGLGVEQDYEKAFEWYLKAAETGSTFAMNAVGCFYYNGKGKDKDYEKAFEWFLKAASQDKPYAESQRNVGECFFNGHGTQQNYVEAFKWHTKAAKQGETFSKLRIGDFYENAYCNKKDYKKAFYWYSKAAEDERDGQAQACVGACYLKEIGVKQDYEKALFYLNKAVKCGYTEALEDVEYAKKKIEEKSRLSSVDIFISWNHNDKDFKNKVRDELFNNGIKVWETDQNSQGKLDESVINAIEKAKGFVILLSLNAFKSSYMPNEVQLILDRINNDHNLEKAIRIQILGNAEDVSKELNQLSEKHPFKKLLPFTMAFGENIKDITDFAQNVVASNIITKYQNQLREKYDIFPISLSDAITKQANKKIIATLELENGYVNRDLFDVNNNTFSPEDLLDINKTALIVAEGGAGKSLYIKNLLRHFSKDNRIFFYFTCGDLKKALLEEPHISLFGLLEKTFAKITNSSIKPSLVVEKLFKDVNKKVYIIFDALDEADTFKDKIIDLINDYKDRIEFSSAQFILTSRAPDLGNLNSEYIQLSLSNINDENIIKIFDAMCERNNANKKDSGVDELNSNAIDREAFIGALKNMSDDIKKNPLLISNIIYIYFANRRIEKQKSFVIEESSNLLIDSLSDEIRNSIIKNIDIERLLEFIAFNSAVKDDDLNIAIHKFLCSLKTGADYSDEVINSICKYLRRKGIIVGHTLSHGIYSAYFASKYIYHKIYRLYEDYDFLDSDIVFAPNIDEKGNGRTMLQKYIQKYFSKSIGLWPDITANLIVKLDYEIHHLYKNGLDEKSITNQTLKETMEEMITDPGIISYTALQVINEMCQKESALYYPELIAKYLE